MERWKVFRALIVLAVLLSLTGFSASAGRAAGAGQAGRGTARLTGVVSDETGAPVPKARITLLLLAQPLGSAASFRRDLPVEPSVFYTATDAKGRWSYQGLGTGRWKISVEADGFTGADAECDVRQLTANPKIALILVRNAAPSKTDPAAADLLEQANDAFALKDYATALGLYRRSRDLNPVYEMVSLSIGDCLKGMGQWDQAMAEFRAVADRTAKNPVDAYLTGLAYVGIAECHWARKEPAAAEDFFRRALAVSDKNALWAYNLAELIMARGAASEAVPVYAQAARIDPTWSEPLYKAGLACLSIGDNVRAVQMLRAFLKIEARSARAVETRRLLQDLERK